MIQGKLAANQAKFPCNICVKRRELKLSLLKFKFFKL